MSSLNIGITFAIFMLFGKVPDEARKLVINDIYLLSEVWINFRNWGPGFKTAGWIQGQLSLSSFQGQLNEYQAMLGTEW